MRISMMGVLLMAQTSPVSAQTIGDEAFTMFRREQVADFQSLENFRDVFDIVISDYVSISEASDYDRATLREIAGETMFVVNQLRDRGKTMFVTVEKNYVAYCLKGIPGPLPCDDYRKTYRAMISHTIMLGRLYYSTREDYNYALSILDE